jgi:nicotinamidase-related amidase
MKRMLLIVDPQNDFITGSLAVPGAKAKMMKLAAYKLQQYDIICVTLDTHPENHCSFEINGGIWPKHCIYNTNGWNIPEYLDDRLMDYSNWSGKLVSYHNKGTEADKEEYSIFDNESNGFTLYTQIKELLSQDDLFIDVDRYESKEDFIDAVKSLIREMRIDGDREIIKLLYTALEEIEEN